MQPDKYQQAIIQHSTSCTVVGAPGSGKTRALFWKIDALLRQGVTAKEIAILCFSYRNLIVMEHLAKTYLGDKAKELTLGTTVDLPLMAIKTAKTEAPPRVIDNNFMRRLLRQAMAEVGFKGHVNEAEHLVRQFKSNAKKPAPNQPHYDLFQVYKQHLEQTELVDRYDMARKHIIGMRNDVYPPLAVKHIFVDNFQDIAEIQSLWLVDHLKAGKKVYAFGCDDLTIFTRDGAQGAQAFTAFEGLNDLKRFTLKQSYRTPEKIGKKAEKVVASLKGRLTPEITYKHDGGSFDVNNTYLTPTEELTALSKQVRALLTKQPEATVGIITRYDLQARQVERALQAQGIHHTSFARSLWETVGATLVLDLLALFLDQTTKSRLRNIFSVFGLTNQTIETLYTNGLIPEGWLSRGAPLPKGVENTTSVNQLRELGQLRQKLVDYTRMIPSLGAKTVFKALAFTLLERLSPEEKRTATFALDELLNTKGNLKQIIATLTQHRQPDPQAQVTVTPVRESRNMAFTHVFVPFITAQNYPFKYAVLPVNEPSERHLLFMALTRASQRVVLSHLKVDPSPFLKGIK